MTASIGSAAPALSPFAPAVGTPTAGADVPCPEDSGNFAVEGFDEQLGTALVTQMTGVTKTGPAAEAADRNATRRLERDEATDKNAADALAMVASMLCPHPVPASAEPPAQLADPSGERRQTRADAPSTEFRQEAVVELPAGAAVQQPGIPAPVVEPAGQPPAAVAVTPPGADTAAPVDRGASDEHHRIGGPETVRRTPAATLPEAAVEHRADIANERSAVTRADGRVQDVPPTDVRPEVPEAAVPRGDAPTHTAENPGATRSAVADITHEPPSPRASVEEPSESPSIGPAVASADHAAVAPTGAGEPAGTPGHTVAAAHTAAPNSTAPHPIGQLLATLPLDPSTAAGQLLNVPAEAPDPELPARLVQSLRMQALRGGGDAIVQLNPEHLGPVTVSLRVEHGTVSAQIIAADQQVAGWLQAHQDLLRDALQTNGLHLDRLTVNEDRKDDRRDRRREPQPRPRYESRADRHSTFELTI